MRRKGMRIKEVLTRTPQLLDELIKVWEDSVRATHFFLSDAQIKQIREYVPQALEKVEHLIIVEEPLGRTIAFMGGRESTFGDALSYSGRAREGYRPKALAIWDLSLISGQIVMRKEIHIRYCI